MTITATIAGAISMLANFAMFFGGNRDNNQMGFIGTLALMILGPLAAGLVQMAISRTREYQADKGGAEICGHPLWLASALQKIAGGAARIPNEEAEENPASAHLFIVNPLHGVRLDNLFATHPPMEERVARLVAMANGAGSTGGSAFSPERSTRSDPAAAGPWSGSVPDSPRGGSRGPWG